jgi:hypothetical protein
MTIERKNLDKYRQDIQAALDEVGLKHGLQISTEGSMRYCSTDFTLKIKGVSTRDSAGNDVDGEEVLFKKTAPLYGISAEKFNAKFNRDAKEFTIKAINTRAKHYPIIAVDALGNRYKFPAEVAA